MPKHCAHPHHRGFTFVELMIGIIVTSIVLCALTVFTFGVSQNWTQSDATQSVFLSSTIGIERINQIVRAAQMIQPNPSPTACMLWTDNYLSDGKIQGCEMSMLEYLPASSTVVKYTAATNTAYYSSLLSEAAFMALPNLTATTVADHVTACGFTSLNATVKNPLPSLEVILQISSMNPAIPSQTVYTTVTLRAPNSSPQ